MVMALARDDQEDPPAMDLLDKLHVSTLPMMVQPMAVHFWSRWLVGLGAEGLVALAEGAAEGRCSSRRTPALTC